MAKEGLVDFLCEDLGIEKGTLLSIGAFIFSGIGTIMSISNAAYTAKVQREEMLTAVNDTVDRKLGGRQ